MLYMRPVQNVSSHILWKIQTFIEGDTRYKKQCTKDNDVSVPFKGGTLGPHTVLPIAISCTIVFSWISLILWNLSPFKGDFSFGKSQKSSLGCRDWCFAKKCCRRRDASAGTLSWGSCQSPVAHSCSLLNHLSSFCRAMLKLNAKFDVDSLLYLLSHFECDSHTVHMLTQQRLPPPLTSTVKS